MKKYILALSLVSLYGQDDVCLPHRLTKMGEAAQVAGVVCCVASNACPSMTICGAPVGIVLARISCTAGVCMQYCGHELRWHPALNKKIVEKLHVARQYMER